MSSEPCAQQPEGCTLSGVELRVLVGAEVSSALPTIAALRTRVFRDWPYLYDGDPLYEARYLEAYARSPRSVFVLACAEGHIVGAATGIPLADDEAHFHAPFIARGIPVEDVFYFGESVLLPAYRGKGLGHRFFDARETHARTCDQFRFTAFCAVDRDAQDPRRPPHARTNDGFWRKRGYERQEDMQCRLAWREVGGEGEGEVMHQLTFWMRGQSVSD